MGRILKQTISRWLPCRLLESELLERARTMAERSKELAAQEAEKAAAMREFAFTIKKLAGEIAQLTECISTGNEDRPVQCAEEFDEQTKRFIVSRNDTGEVIANRPMTKEELQGDLFGADARKSDEKITMLSGD